MPDHAEGRHLLFETSPEGITTISLDDPATRNALTSQMVEELVHAFTCAESDEKTRCVVLRSTHPTVFSAGGDLRAFAADEPMLKKHTHTAKLADLFRLVSDLGKPTLCAASGHVVAGAFGLALACDLVIATEAATFATPEITVGIFPFMIMALIYRNVPRKKASELLLLGERIGAAEAELLGFVNRVVPEDGFDQTVESWARKLASHSPLILQLGKQAMSQQRDLPLDAALELLNHKLSLVLSTDDAREGVSAFFERREPNWVGT